MDRDAARARQDRRNFRRGRLKMTTTATAIEPDASAPTDEVRIRLADAPLPDTNGGPRPAATMAELYAAYERIITAGGIQHPVPYTFLRELGRGHQGRVFLGRRNGARGCRVEYAIKLYDPSIYRTPDEYWTDMGRIARQLSLLQRLQSTSMVSRHIYEEEEGIGYIAMDAIDGVDLRRLMSRSFLKVVRPLCTPEEWRLFSDSIFRVQEGSAVSLQTGIVVYVMRRALRSIEYLHSMSFLHADIKPDNIMIDRLGTVRMIDFGRAVRVGESVSFLLGSPLYMAPEIHQRKPGGIQSDIYSIGLVAIELLRGQRLTDDPDVDERGLLELKLTLPERLPALMPRHVTRNAELMDLLQRCIAVDPDRRYAAAADAEVGSRGLRVIEKQLVQAGLDTEYGRDLGRLLSKLVNPLTGRVELPAAS